MRKQIEMSLWDHFGELRKRLFIVFIVFAIGMVIGFFLAGDVIAYIIEHSSAKDLEQLYSFHPTDAFKVYLLFSISVGIILALPFALYQIWAFVSPGLTLPEKRLTLSYIPIAIMLFLIGLAFGYFMLFPYVFMFMNNIATQIGTEVIYGVHQYFSFMFSLVIPFGFLFQLPIAILFLTRLELITPKKLKQIRKFAYFGLFVIAALITPPELMSHLLVTVPLIILYELSVLLSSWSYRQQQRARYKRALQNQAASEENVARDEH